MNHGTCIHYNGFIGRMGEPEPRRCEAGVCYQQEFGSGPGIAMRAPCIEYTLRSPRGGTRLREGEAGTREPWRPAGAPPPLPCSRRIEPTDEQVLADQRETDAYLARHITVMRVVAEWRTWSKENRVAKSGVIECPACKGRLHLSQAAYNGHVHGKCETKGCASWLE